MSGLWVYTCVYERMWFISRWRKLSSWVGGASFPPHTLNPVGGCWDSTSLVYGLCGCSSLWTQSDCPRCPATLQILHLQAKKQSPLTSALQKRIELGEGKLSKLVCDVIPPNQAVQLGLAGGLWIRKLLVARASQYLGFSTRERISAKSRCRNPGSMAVPPTITRFSDRTLRVSMGHWWDTKTRTPHDAVGAHYTLILVEHISQTRFSTLTKASSSRVAIDFSSLSCSNNISATASLKRER